MIGAAFIAGLFLSCSLYGSWDLLGFLSTQYLSRSEVIDPDNWEQIQGYLEWLASRGVSGPPTVDTGTISGLGGSNKWYGGVLAPNGKIYGVPGAATSVLIIDPQTDTADTTTISGLPGTASPPNWLGGILAANGKIYCIPWDAVSVLIIDPATDTADTTTMSGGLLNAMRKWHGGVLARNGKIYGIPCDSDLVLVVDPVTDTFTTITIPDPPGPLAPDDPDKWYGGVLAPNGQIYCIPWNAEYVMIIDPATDTVDPDAILFSASATLKWVGGVLAANGRIYCVPREAGRVLVIDPARNTVDFISGVPLWGNKWAGGVLGPDGKIYGIPRDETGILVIDPTTATADPNGIALPPAPVNPADSDKWTGGVLAPNGKIYGIPNSASSVLIIDLHSNGEVFNSIAECAYFNKF